MRDDRSIKHAKNLSCSLSFKLDVIVLVAIYASYCSGKGEQLARRMFVPRSLSALSRQEDSEIRKKCNWLNNHNAEYNSRQTKGLLEPLTMNSSWKVLGDGNHPQVRKNGVLILNFCTIGNFTRY